MSRIRTGNELESAKRSLFNDISSILKSINDQSVSIYFDKRSSQAVSSDILRIISDSIEKSSYRDLLISAFINSERRVAGSGFLFLKMYASSFCDQSFLKFGNRAQTVDIQKILNFYSGKEASNIALSAFKLAGRDGKLFLEKDQAPQTQIIVSSQRIDWKPSSEFFNMLSRNSIRLRNPALVFIDGIIESVAECHKIFQDSHDKSIPVLVFARGFNDDVISTSVENIRRETAFVVPIVIPYDIVGANSLADLAMCFETDVVSSLKGDLISSIDISTVPRINEANVSQFGIEVQCERSQTDSVVEGLNSRLKHVSEDDSNVIMSRIKKIGHHAVTIKVGQDSSELFGIKRDRIDACLRLLPIILRGGILRRCDHLESFKKLSLSSDSIPFESAAVAYQTLQSFNELIKKNKCLVSLK